jgi:hypothetical protein
MLKFRASDLHTDTEATIFVLGQLHHRSRRSIKHNVVSVDIAEPRQATRSGTASGSMPRLFRKMRIFGAMRLAQSSQLKRAGGVVLGAAATVSAAAATCSGGASRGIVVARPACPSSERRFVGIHCPRSWPGTELPYHDHRQGRLTSVAR